MNDPITQAINKVKNDLSEQIRSEVSKPLDTLRTQVERAASFPAEAAQNFERFRAELDRLVGSLPPFPVAPPPPPPPPAMDPLPVLRQIASAFHAAEGVLNEKNLLIASGTVEIDLNVRVGDAAGAQARIRFQISPTPFT